MNNTIQYSSDIARKLTKGYGSTSQPIYVDNNGEIQLANNIQTNGGDFLPLTGGTVTGDTTIETVLTIGKKTLTTAPGSLTSVNRIILNPPYHTGGPWYLKTEDDSGSAYIGVYYNTDLRFRMKHDGTFSFSGSGIVSGAFTCSNTIKSTYAGPAFLAQTTAGTWSYLRLHNGSNLWDIATRSDHWSGALELRPGGGDLGYYFSTGDMPSGAANLSAAASQHSIHFYRNGFAIPYGMDNPNDGGIFRVRGAAETACICEIGTWDDSGSGETIQFNYYPTTSQITPTYSVSVPKASGTICLTNGTGASGTWGISISGNSATTSRCNGRVYCTDIGTSWIGSRDTAIVNCDVSSSTSSTAFTVARVKFASYTFGICSERAGNVFGIYGWTNSRTANGTDGAFYISGDMYFRTSTRIYGAVWNDFAEYRESTITEGGRVVYDDGSGIMKLTTERLQKAARIISDTYGFAVGESDKAKTPIGVGGRVLVYPYQLREKYKPGDAICAAPNGTCDIMTEEEIKQHPDRIIGIVSEIPVYDIWEQKFQDGQRGHAYVKVNGRIWVYVR